MVSKSSLHDNSNNIASFDVLTEMVENWNNFWMTLIAGEDVWLDVFHLAFHPHQNLLDFVCSYDLTSDCRLPIDWFLNTDQNDSALAVEH